MGVVIPISFPTSPIRSERVTVRSILSDMKWTASPSILKNFFSTFFLLPSRSLNEKEIRTAPPKARQFFETASILTSPYHLFGSSDEIVGASELCEDEPSPPKPHPFALYSDIILALAIGTSI